MGAVVTIRTHEQTVADLKHAMESFAEEGATFAKQEHIDEKDSDYFMALMSGITDGFYHDLRRLKKAGFKEEVTEFEKQWDTLRKTTSEMLAGAAAEKTKE